MFKPKNILLSHVFRYSFLFILCIIVTCSLRSTISPVEACQREKLADDGLSYIILSNYKEKLMIGDEFYLLALTSNGKKPTFKSSDSKIASVNTYGCIKAKKDGKVTITAKIKGAEAACNLTIERTDISLNTKSASLESGRTIALEAITSNGAIPKFKSSKSSVASVDEHGLVTTKKPGEAIITIKADTTSVTCKITVKKPTIELNRSKATLFRTQSIDLSCKVSSGKTPKWKSNRKSVATVDDKGIVTAVKHGTALITATVDGVSKTCEIIVTQPTIELSQTELILFPEDIVTLCATTSSPNTPTWSTSNTSILLVEEGRVTAVSPGTAYIYAKEDGAKARCKIKVIKLPENQKKSAPVSDTLNQQIQ